MNTRYFAKLQTLTSWTPTRKGLQAKIDDATLTIDVLGEGILRLEITHEGRHAAPPTYSVSADLASLQAEFTLSETENTLTLKTKGINLTIHRSPFSIDARRPDGTEILQASDYASLNDEFIVTRKGNPEDVIYGLGQKTGRLNRNGRKFTLWNTDVLNPNTVGEFSSNAGEDASSTTFDPYYISIPFYSRIENGTHQAAGFFIDNAHKAKVEFEEDKTSLHFAGGSYVEYIFAGPTLQEILRDYTLLTGRMPVPPIWSLGYHHCRWHPYKQSDVLEIAARYRALDFPCDSIWLDIDHMDGYRVFTWNPTTYPEPQQMLAQLKATGFQTVTIVDPGVKDEPGYSVHDSGVERDVFCRTESGARYIGQVWPGKTLFPDFVSPEARTWWGELNANHVRSGLAGIWNDMNEPATGNIPAEAMRFDHGRYSHGAYHNAYALLMAMATAEGLRAALPDQRPFILSRAGSPGIQRYAANWLGDNMSRWDHLAMSVPMSLGLGLSGQSFVGADIGGFGESCTPELLVRWFQCAALTPFCRLHNSIGSPDQYPWSFGPEVEEWCRASIQLRYRLMPYLYSAFVETSLTGVPIMRPLGFEDPTMANVDDAYLLGNALLVAPVTEAGVTERTVTLPKGTWFDWWTGTPHQGTIQAAAPIDRIPLFVREGTVLPLWPIAPASTMNYHPEVIHLRVFVPTTDGTFKSTFIEDDGTSFAYEQGTRLTTHFHLTRQGSHLTLQSQTTGNPFPAFNRKCYQITLIGASGEALIPDQGQTFTWTTDLP